MFWKKHGTIRVRTAFPGKAERWDGYVNCGKLNSPALYGICGAIAIGFAFLEYKKAGKKKEENKT